MPTTCPSHPDAPQPSVCESCAMIARRRRARRNGAVVFAALAVPVVAVSAYLFTRPKHAPPAPPRAMDQLETDMRARLAQEPCQPTTTMNLVEHLMEQQLYDVALADAYRSLGRCGVVDVVPWRITYMHQVRHEWAAAAFTSTMLLDQQPRDSDFWWWRGEAFAYAGHPWPALADYRQSLANSDDAQAGGFAAARVAAPALPIGGRCEGARAWHFYVRALGGEMTQEARDDYAALVRAGTCASEDGVGTARLPIDAMSGTGAVSVTAGGATGSFRVDPGAGTTIVSRAFAAKAGITTQSPDRGASLYGGAIVRGQPGRAAKLEVAGAGAGASASAANVDVLVSDDLAPGEDGVLGLSFLWHFDFGVAGGAVTLAPRADVAAR
jgi:aspartyl protease family protein